jgi:uncharacterized protein
MDYDDGRFEWDVEKAEINAGTHGVTFEEAREAYDDPRAVELFDREHSDFEPRFARVGLSRRRLLFVVFTERAGRIRLLHARKAAHGWRRFMSEKTFKREWEEPVDEDESKIEEEFRFNPKRWEVMPKGVRKVRVTMFLDDDVVAHFKARAEQPNAAPYQTQINQTLREAMGRDRQTAAAPAAVSLDDPAFLKRLAERVVEYLPRPQAKRKARAKTKSRPASKPAPNAARKAAAKSARKPARKAA